MKYFVARSKRMFLAAALGLITPLATAAYLNPNGLGQVLIYPYYTVNNNYVTFVSVINTTNTGKAVKVRLLESYNGRDVQDFNLYLSPTDYWVGAVVDSGNGGAAIFTTDNSCTVPKLPTSAPGLAFTTKNFDGTGIQGADGGPSNAARTREGHVEIIEMGTVNGPSLVAITHNNGVPTDCPSIVGAWASGGRWQAAPSTDIGPPTGGLSGNATMIDVGRGMIFSYDAEAVAQFYAAGSSPQHTDPSSLTPNISSGTSLMASVSTEEGGTFPLTFSRAIDAVSALFMTDSVQNEYWTSATTASASDWVITYPTKRFYVDPYYVMGASALPPFDNKFSSANGGTAPVASSAVVFDREEYTPSPSAAIFPPPPIQLPSLPYETQVVTFNQAKPAPSAVLGSNLSFNVATSGLANGWAEIGGLLPNQPSASFLLTASNGETLSGRPTTGFRVSQLINGNVGGILANYTVLYQHKMHVACRHSQNSSDPCS